MNVPINVLALVIFIVAAGCDVALRIADAGGTGPFEYTLAAAAGAVLGVSVPGVAKP